ncbi:MAG: tRNA threonylcarbamoyladenosine dehydratase [Myxococcales bacterium]|nr:tRNA threonylcarbamoyladenosine dehydratase [Myxococcales bacterium]|tara:strand:+ start:3516 stop:4487 length:972 start_codon:yes stop_codon:yes gene_type:complete
MSQTEDGCCSTEPAESSFKENLAEENKYRLHRRFDRLGRLYGDRAVSRLMQSKVVVFGVGGVGSFAAEALVRSAIGHITLVDFDDVCVTNANRQLQALKGNIGKPKAWVLRDRLQLINPQAQVVAKRAFYNAQRSEALLTPPWPEAQQYDYVVDCIDNMTAKGHLLKTCKDLGIPVISSMGAAGKLDPTRIQIADIANTQVDPMAREMRHILRKKHGLPGKGPMGITAVYSDEHRAWPKELTYDEGEGFRCVCPTKYQEHNCDSQNLIDGTAAFVTGAFGLACASHVINTLTAMLRETAKDDRDEKGFQAKNTQRRPVRLAAP